MANYRDDSNDTAVISDSTWMGLTAIAESTAKVAAVLVFCLSVMHVDTATASDQALDRAGHVMIDSAAISEDVLDQVKSNSLTMDTLRASDQVIGRLGALLTDGATISDDAVEVLRHLLIDEAAISDEVAEQRYSAVLVTDIARISDAAPQFASELIEDAISGSDWSGGRMTARVRLEDSAGLRDEVIDEHRARTLALVDGARLSSQVIDYLAARDLIMDLLMGHDVVVGSGSDQGQAWTANVDSWAMSRYAPYSFAGLAVIDGVAYGMAADGVYALDGGAEAISGRIQTGKLDIGQGGLVHPLAAYLEYELDGTAEMDVTTTQSGQAETYTYTLPAETADELTNGRFIFGRGLRGRHFSFALRMTGTHGYINDLSVNTAPTKRRV